MIDLRKIKELTTNSKLIEFAEFVIAETGDRRFPDYKKIDLMKIPKLVSNIWVFDFRNGISDGMQYLFSGTAIDAHFGKNIMGLRFEDVYFAEDAKKLIENSHHQVYLQGKIGYTHRNLY